MNENWKLRVEKEPIHDGGKPWVRVYFHTTKQSWVPSFEDLYYIVKAIAEVEEDKYPNGKGRFMVSEFLADACRGLSYDSLRERYQLPQRFWTVVNGGQEKLL